MNKWQTINVSEFNEHWEDWRVADIRDENSYSQGHIPGSINLNNLNIQNFINENDFDEPVVVVCYVGNSSKGAADFLAQAGFNKVYSLNGGMSDWRIQYPEIIDYS
jgi:thiosulfate sulfurtransferase